VRNAGEGDTADRDPVTLPRSRSAANRVFAYLVMLGWHGLVIIAYFVLLDRQSGMRVNYGNSPREDMLIFGFYGALILLVTLLAGLTLLRDLLEESRINSAIVLGTAAASPTLLFVAVAAGPVLR
jgi:DMSO/TMAO reductase YedYZ heme-binding membrane subunit